MRNVGLLAYATKTGLGYQTKAFYDHVKPEKTLVANLSRLNGMPVDLSWYPDAQVHDGIINEESINKFLDGLDVIFVAETPLNYYLFKEAKRRGIKTIQQFNPEFLDFINHPDWCRPTVLAAPSPWLFDMVDSVKGDAKLMHLPVPIETDKFAYRNRKETKTFVHVIGRPALHDRNGTIQFLQAAEVLGTRFSYKIYVQPPVEYRAIEYFAPVKQEINRVKAIVPTLEVIENIEDNRKIYESGDVFVLPRKYGGLCLPAQEAQASGMPVIMSDISPNHKYTEIRVEAEYEGIFRGHAEIRYFKTKTDKLVEAMLKFSDNIYTQWESAMAYSNAKKHDWDALLPKYLEVLELC